MMKIDYPALYQSIVRDDLEEFKSYPVDFLTESTNYLMEAIENNAQKIMTFLCVQFPELMNRSDEPYHFDFPLSKAMELGYFEMATILLHHGANINGHPLSFNTPIRNALHPTSLERMQFLMKKGADVNIFPAKHNYTVLDLAYFNQKTEQTDYFTAIEYLIQNGARASREIVDHQSNLQAKLSEKLGKILNFSFPYKESLIQVGLSDNRLNYYFVENETAIHLIILDADWPVSSNSTYNETPFSCFLELLNWSQTQIEFQHTILVKELPEIHFPINCKGFTVEQLNEILDEKDKKINLFIPFDGRKKSLKSKQELPKNLTSLSYQYPTDNRNHKISTSKLLFPDYNKGK